MRGLLGHQGNNGNTRRGVRVWRNALLASVLLSSAAACQAQTMPAAAPTAKSTRTAVRYSLLSTAIPVVTGGVVYFGFSNKFDNWDDAESILAASIGGAGIIFGPGVGHCYAGNGGHMVTGALIRSLLLGFIPMGAAWGQASSGEASVGPGIILFIGPAVYSAVHDIATLGRVVDKYNRRHYLTRIEIASYVHASRGRTGVLVSLYW